MRKLYIVGLIALAAVIIGLAWAEQMTFSTYYPAPYGVYRQMVVSSRESIGDVNIDGQWNSGDMAVDGSGNPIEGSLTVASNVGIGTKTPHALLDIAEVGDTGLPNILSRDNNMDIAVEDTEAMQIGHFDISTDTFTERMRLDVNGNFGIGTASPERPLDVNGVVKTQAALLEPVDDPDADIPNPENGMICCDKGDNTIKQYDAGTGQWKSFGGGGWTYVEATVATNLNLSNSSWTLLPNLAAMIGNHRALVILKVKTNIKNNALGAVPYGDSSSYNYPSSIYNASGVAEVGMWTNPSDRYKLLITLTDSLGKLGLRETAGTANTWDIVLVAYQPL